jgi:hypothetical protein
LTSLFNSSIQLIDCNVRLPIHKRENRNASKEESEKEKALSLIKAK